nr:ABC transporter permease subunit [Bradyrhizobium sp. 182]
MLNTIAAVKQVEPLRITSARTMRAPPQQLSAVVLPAALPTIVVGIRLASASVMLVLVASEMVGAKGLFHHQQPAQFLIPQMYPRDYSRRAYVQCHPAGDRVTFHAMESVACA